MIEVNGLKFHFGGEKEINTKKGANWLSFCMYVEFSVGGTQYGVIFRNMKIHNNRPAPPMAPYAPGKFFNLAFFSKNFAESIVAALLQWDVVKENEKWNPLGALNPARSLMYDKKKVEELFAKRLEIGLPEAAE